MVSSRTILASIIAPFTNRHPPTVHSIIQTLPIYFLKNQNPFFHSHKILQKTKSTLLGQLQVANVALKDSCVCNAIFATSPAWYITLPRANLSARIHTSYWQRPQHTLK